MAMITRSTIVVALCAALLQLGCDGLFFRSHKVTSGSGTGSTTTSSGGSQTGGSTSSGSIYVYDGPADIAPTKLCKRPGEGPQLPFDGAYSGKFPIKPILALYDKADCRTLSPAFLRRVVTDLPGYLAGSIELSAPVGDLKGATIELTGFTESMVRGSLGISGAESTQAGLERVYALYVRSFGGGQAALDWKAYLDSLTLGGYVADAIAQVVTGLSIGWGEQETAQTLGVTTDQLLLASAGGDSLYREVLGVTRSEALALLDQYGLSKDDVLDQFLSLIHVSKPSNGRRYAYAFVVDGDMTPVRHLNRGDFEVRVDGSRVPTEELSVQTLEQLADTDKQTVQFAISFVLDYSGSMSSQDKKFLEEALVYFLDQLPPVYRASVIKFNSKVSTYQTLTRDAGTLKDAITRTMSSGSTALYDAMGKGLEELKNETVPFRLQLVFTDGMENSSKVHCHDSVVALSHREGIPVFVMGMGDIDVPAMMSMTNDTNACFLYAPSNEQIKQIYQAIGSVMAQTYVVSWPLRKSDPTTVQIDATTPAGLVGDAYTMLK